MRQIIPGAIIALAFVSVILVTPHRAPAADDPAALAPGDGAKRPSVAGLVVGAEPPMPRSFVVEGVARTRADIGLLFRVVKDDDRELTIFSDARDGTPLVISDGRQSLVYDVADGQVVLVPLSRATVRVDWDRKQPKPLSFGIAINTATKPDSKGLTELGSWVRIDRFVEAAGSDLRPVDGAPPGLGLFRYDRRTSVESLQTRPGEPGWFRFESQAKEEGFRALELEAKHIDGPVPAGALAFPDLARLEKDIKVIRPEPTALSQTASLMRNGRAWIAKLALGGDAADREKAEKLFLTRPDWDQIRERDAKLAPRFRAALAAQGFDAPALPSAAPASKPQR